MTDTQVSFNDLIDSDNSSNDKTRKKKTGNSGKKNTKTTGTRKKTATKVSVSSSASGKKTQNKSVSKAKANSKTVKTATRKKTVRGRNSKVNITQEDMDKLCEVYDWYLRVRDLNIVDQKSSAIKSSVILDEDIIKSKKRISSIVDEEIWDDFSRLCENTGLKKGDVLTFAIKEFLIKHKDLI